MAASKTKTEPETPRDELIARFQLETERALDKLRTDMLGLHEDLARKVAAVQDSCAQMTEAVRRQTRELEDAVHHTRNGVKECNEALKVAAKAARDAADSAAVFEKLKDSQPDFAAQVRALEARLAKVVDTNAHLAEQFTGLTRRLDEFELVAESMEETKGEVRGIDQAVKILDRSVRASRPLTT